MSKEKVIKRVISGSIVGLLVVIAVFSYIIYNRIFSPNVTIGQKAVEYIYIPTGASFEKVVWLLDQDHVIINEKSFRWAAHQMKYDVAVKPGRYRLKPDMTNKELIKLLRSGMQSPVNVVFNNIRTKQQFCDRVAEQIEATSPALMNLLNDHDYTGRLGFNPDNILAMFIPNTYELYWNTSADRFLQRMAKEYKKFWTTERGFKAGFIGLSQIQVSILASIVQQESNKVDEKPIIAGVYMNRLNKDWKLDADPTLVYALGDFTITRVLNIHKEIPSPYNTYKYKGLPPGPICLPTAGSIDAVLNYTKHKYFYFCAKEDFSGYHSFAETYLRHLLNARRFQKALDQRRILQ